MRAAVIALIATHVGAAGAGYYYCSHQDVSDTEVEHCGLFQTDTKRVLSATVDSLKTQNQLLVLAYKGTVRVQAERTKWFLFGGHQELIVPGVVSYYLNLSALSLADVAYNEKAKIVAVNLPPVTTGPIAFIPEQAMATGGGILLWSEEQVEELRKMNYASARRAMAMQARQPVLLDAANRQAITDIQNNFEIPLRIAGMPDVKVVAKFKQ